MSSPPPARRYLAAADQMLRGAGSLGSAAVAGGWWPKACACLIRMALEAGLREYWQRVNPPVAACHNGRAKLVLLRRRCARPLVRRTTYAWNALSRAMHHHAYETAPTVTELRHLHTEVTSVISALHGVPMAGRPGGT